MRHVRRALLDDETQARFHVEVLNRETGEIKYVGREPSAAVSTKAEAGLYPWPQARRLAAGIRKRARQEQRDMHVEAVPAAGARS